MRGGVVGTIQLYIVVSAIGICTVYFRCPSYPIALKLREV